METRKIIERVALTIFVFSFTAGVYICGCAWFHPETLPIQLTHHTPWIREDDFGMLSWIVSFCSFLTWNLIRK